MLSSAGRRTFPAATPCCRRHETGLGSEIFCLDCGRPGLRWSAWVAVVGLGCRVQWLAWTVIVAGALEWPSLNLRRWMLAQGFRGDFSVGAINVCHVFIKFALEEDYTKLWIKSIWFMDGFLMRVLKWTPIFNPWKESPIVPVWVRLSKLPIQFFDRETMFSIAHLLGTPLRTDVSTAILVRPSVARVKLDAQRAQWKFHTRRKGKRVVFEDVDGRLGASSSGAKGTEDVEVEVELHDTVFPAGMPEHMLHGEAVDGGTEKDIPVSQSKPDVCQGVDDVATYSLEPIVPEKPLPQDGLPGVCAGQTGSCVIPPALDSRVEQPVCVENLIPDTEDATLYLPGESILHTHTEDVARRLARHRRGRSLDDEPGAHLVSSDRGKRGDLWRGGWVFWMWYQIVGIRFGSSGGSDVRCQIVGGDFNTVLSPDECSGGSESSGIAMSDFHDTISDSALVDAGNVESPYTWYSRRLHQRLDRALVSSCWMTVFPKLQYPTVGSGIMRFQQKLTRLKHCLKEWNKTVFGNVFDRVAAAERQLKEADEAYDQDPCDRTLVE
ncbi:UNVERIFIED_CONTAM: hypothetical protein Sradi_6119900 [Sesamum radiatum]|uniref:DUF4283 domain-containing protein n=1 Tax=Sesamum radiatum TaxID=300843 RepID=A0AAW2KLG5_SESRA